VPGPDPLQNGFFTLAQEGENQAVSLVSEQLIVLATIVGAIAALPALIEFILETRKRRERIALSLDDEPVAKLDVRMAGMDDLLHNAADLIDRAKHPDAYESLQLGNELLIIGPALSGKKTLARRIAQLAGMERLITVYNPRNSDALAKAKSLLRRKTDEKVVLLIPNIDEVFDEDDQDDEVEAELDGLIETVAGRSNVLVIATASAFHEGSDIDNLFGMKIVLPGAQRDLPEGDEIPQRAFVKDQMRPLMASVARLYVEQARQSGCDFDGLSDDETIARLLAAASNPAEIQDILEAARTTATFLHRTKQAPRRMITAAVLEKAISRVMAGA